MQTGCRDRDGHENIKSPIVCRNLGEGFGLRLEEGIGAGVVVAMDTETPIVIWVVNEI